MDLSGENPGEELDLIAREIRVCRRCPLWEGACRAVPGEGDPGARIMLVGEAPGRKEDLKGRPFVGKSGTLLDTMFHNTGIARQSIFIGNLVKHRPPQNRAPTPGEIRACTPFLKRQIDTIRPALIITLGRLPATFFLSLVPVAFTRLGDIRGRPYTLDRDGYLITVIPTYHPAYASRNPRYRALLEKDFSSALHLLHSGGAS